MANQTDGSGQERAGKSPTFKVFKDPIHGSIEVSEECVAIIDTPQFQRLRYIKQLGFGSFVYPGATHNRFEHCIGVCHLAGEMVRSLQRRQPELPIDDKDILCVEIAGLCHDLGHGPFSHVFDGKFIPRITPDSKWKHEETSKEMFDYLIEETRILTEDGEVSLRNKYKLEDRDITFIKELIDGVSGKTDEPWTCQGRGEEYSFLYEIVANKRTGVDVDKWDYFARDCHYLGMINDFDYKRYIQFVRVLKVNNRRVICPRDKEIGNLYKMFYTRYNLHRTAYQHPVTCACELMAVDALEKANPHLDYSVPGSSKKRILSETIKDMPTYTTVTDNVLWDVYTSRDDELSGAKDIINRLFCRDLYRCLREISISEDRLLSEEGQDKTKTRKLEDVLTEEMTKRPSKLNKSDFHLQTVTMNFGKKDKDPLKDIKCYSKKNPDLPIDAPKTGLLIPQKFVDKRLRVYSTVSSKVKDFKAINKAITIEFEEACQNLGLIENEEKKKEDEEEEEEKA